MSAPEATAPEATAPEATETPTTHTASYSDQRMIEQVLANAGTLSAEQLDALRALLPAPADRAGT